ncbi:MAG: Light-independent protochlorophyllide reductase subunit N [uncultured Rubrobacteraceae bacterium]|uniref:Light-independent protochlorophyllide reductase subunit N n=1 Tax=uncultured Rubrobacteraceae bacterium TaxID=349277 RepID=A0A6J4QV78_9ACTN|nr:MAG: Light-independent protochlorophyllide reductase subunit N [uncultured Rubrobacteraceae bacterium]
MTILNESGIPDVLHPLHAVNGLAGTLPGTLVIVVGMRSEAHVVRSFPGGGPGGRVLFAVLDPQDPPQQGQLANLAVDAAGRRAQTVLIVGSRTATALGVDVDFEARLAARKSGLAVAAVDADTPYANPGTLSTDLEDRVLAALVDLCPKRRTSELVEAASQAKRGGFFGLGGRNRERPAEPGRPVVLLGGALSPGSAAGLVAELSRTGVEAAGVVPSAGGDDLPPVGEGTVVAVMDPNLGAAANAARERGARVVRTLMPIGVDGTARFLQDVAEDAGARTSEVMRARSVWEELGALRNRVRGKRIFFAGDTGYEVPLARFLADAGAVVLEVGAPRLDRRFLAEELQALGSGVDVVVAPDWRGQMARIEDSNPDVVVASAGLHAPLVARGHLCRGSQDFVRAGLHGYEGARRILELLARTFERAEALDTLSL